MDHIRLPGAGTVPTPGVSPMLRFTLHVVTTVTLLLFVAAAAAWVRGGFMNDMVLVGRGDDGSYAGWSFRVEVNAGLVTLGHRADKPVRQRPSNVAMSWKIKHLTWPVRSTVVRRWFRWELGFRREAYKWSNQDVVGAPRIATREWYATAPIWLVMSALAAVPLLRWAVPWMRRRKRRVNGLCPGCGYDLRGGGGGCPECGAGRDAGAAGPPPDGEAGAAASPVV